MEEFVEALDVSRNSVVLASMEWCRLESSEQRWQREKWRKEMPNRRVECSIKFCKIVEMDFIILVRQNTSQ